MEIPQTVEINRRQAIGGSVAGIALLGIEIWRDYRAELRAEREAQEQAARAAGQEKDYFMQVLDTFVKNCDCR